MVISDASPKPPNDPDAEFEHDADSVRQIAEDNGIRLIAMHMKTPDGKPNHRAAQRAYSEMTASGSNDARYYPVEIDSSEDIDTAFRPQVEEIANFVINQYEENVDDLQQRRDEQGLNPLEEASLAMRLEWLGRDRNTSAPDVIEAWTLDFSMEDPNVPSIDVRLLVTKNQLANMQVILQEILTAGEQEGSENFFETLRGAFARLSQDPNNLINEDFETLDRLWVSSCRTCHTRRRYCKSRNGNGIGWGRAVGR